MHTCGAVHSVEGVKSEAAEERREPALAHAEGKEGAGAGNGGC